MQCKICSANLPESDITFCEKCDAGIIEETVLIKDISIIIQILLRILTEINKIVMSE